MPDTDQTPLTTTNQRGVLWDLDGTLIDSMPVHFRAWQAALAPEGFDLTWETFLPTFGWRNDTILRTWLGADLDHAEVLRISKHKEALYREILPTTRQVLLPGAAHWLKALHTAGWRQALATMGWQANLEAIFSALTVDIRGYFDTIVTADVVRQGKPDPEIFLTAAERLGVPPNRCVVIEDSPAGLEAARRAGMRSVGVNAKERLTVDYYLPSLEQLTWAMLEVLI